MASQCISSLQDTPTNIARNTDIGDVICFNVIHDIYSLSLLSALLAYSYSSMLLVNTIFTESHHGLDFCVQLLKIN